MNIFSFILSTMVLSVKGCTLNEILIHCGNDKNSLCINPDTFCRNKPICRNKWTMLEKAKYNGLIGKCPRNKKTCKINSCNIPTQFPSFSPTQSPQMSLSPSYNPTQYPSYNPTQYPSYNPTQSPSFSLTQSLSSNIKYIIIIPIISVPLLLVILFVPNPNIFVCIKRVIF